MTQRKSLIIFFLILSVKLFSQNGVADSIRSMLVELQQEYRPTTRYRLNDLKISHKRHEVKVMFSDSFASIPFNEAIIDSLKNKILRFLPKEQRKYKVNIFAAGDNIEMLVPNIYRKELEKDKSRLSKTNRQGHSFVRNLNRPFEIEQGLQHRNIAVWNSHGWYYEQRLDRWEWQRARILTTVEDKFTTQIVLNYLVPMLENAGAYIFVPRERDPQTEVIICDKDESWNSSRKLSQYREFGNMAHLPEDRQVGFADRKEFYIDRENPFVMGSASLLKTARKADLWVEYLPKFGKADWYSVSVAYRSVADGIDDAHYTVYHSGGKSEFVVDQTMAGSTWVYLGTFHFDPNDEERHCKVVLSNASKKAGHWVVADAVKFGGGMGNIARRPATQAMIDAIPDETTRKKAKLLSPFAKDSYTSSGRAKFWEGSRYYLQWAGMPFDVYSHSYGINDYIDDYASRGKWVNHLNYGSANAPDSTGLGVPIDLSLAFHSDAGIDTTTVGTLAIVSTKNDKQTLFPNQQNRYASMDMANIVLDQIKRDIRHSFDSTWTIRGINNANYAESRFPSVPSMILESMSHQNFDDMRLGLNPRFQFAFARAVYKGVLRFLSYQNHTHYVVQPLPVHNFAAILQGDSVRLSWSPTTDPLEPTAEPYGYVVYTRKNIGNTPAGGFDNGVFVKNNEITIPIGTDTIFSYKITAVNEGGESFPSEILSVCKADNAKGEVLIINGFTKTSEAAYIDQPQYKGFLSAQELAIPYRNDYAYTGSQYDFDLANQWTDDDAPGFGASYGINEQIPIAGNSFDYPYIHGQAIKEAGYSFSSCAVETVEKGIVSLDGVKAVDLILGKQKRMPNAFSGEIEFQTFTPSLQEAIKIFLAKGNSLFVSGAYIGKDLYGLGSSADADFARNTLKLLWRTDKAAKNCNTVGVYSPLLDMSDTMFDNISDRLGSVQYAVESVDAIEPVNGNAYTIMRYIENSMSAAIVSNGAYRVAVLGFPFETITNKAQRVVLMKNIMQFLK